MPIFGLEDASTALVLAPHPDDETLGAGGTIARLITEGIGVHVLVLSVPDQVDVRTKEFEAACRVLGVRDRLVSFHPLSDSRDLVTFLESGTALSLEHLSPDLLFLPDGESHHQDHRSTHQAALAAARPRPGGQPRIVVGYRGPDDHWPIPRGPARVSVDITSTRATKHTALRCYATQLYEPPHPRSLTRIQASETAAGSQVGTHAAEQFTLYRMAF